MKRMLLTLLALCATADTPQGINLYTQSDLSGIKQQLANKKTAFASEELKRYGNHYTMLAYRTMTGSAEIHEHEADIFVIEEGDASIILGGKMVGGHTEKNGAKCEARLLRAGKNAP